MRKILLVTTFACVCLVSSSIAQQKAQDSSAVVTLPVRLQTNEEKRAQNFFVELLGQGLWVSANYDARFGNRRNGLGGRIGIGVGPSDLDLFREEENETPIIFPVSLNYLLGNGTTHFFEIGLGATLITGQDGGLIGTTSFSYRLQPLNNGFTVRAGLTPVLADGEFSPLFGGLSLGYTF